jgi:uncharacterized protein YyaL (SSP411 family)
MTTQDGAEPSATSVSAHNLSRLSLLHSNEFEAYEQKAEKTYLSIGNELEQIPRAFGYSVAGLMDLEKGYREVSVHCTRISNHLALMSVIGNYYWEE